MTLSASLAVDWQSIFSSPPLLATTDALAVHPKNHTIPNPPISPPPSLPPATNFYLRRHF